MKAVVTGGSGYLGKHVAGYFGADDFSRRSGRDILNGHDVAEIGDYDLVIHLAARLDKNPDAAEEVFLTNVEGTINVLKNVREGAAFVFASTKDVYGRFAANFVEVPEGCQTVYSGQSALEWSKLIAEHYVEYYAHANRFRSAIFRLSTVYAPPSEGNTPSFVGAFADAINMGEPLRLPGGGRPVRDLMHVDDLSSACQAFADSVIRHGTYNIGGGRANALTLHEIVKKLEEVSGLEAVVDEGNPLPDPFPLNYVSDLGRVDQELGWRPRVGVDVGLKTLFGAIRAE
jgi:nucleoside-diphosphate-sugar epimerase